MIQHRNSSDYCKWRTSLIAPSCREFAANVPNNKRLFAHNALDYEGEETSLPMQHTATHCNMHHIDTTRYRLVRQILMHQPLRLSLSLSGSLFLFLAVSFFLSFSFSLSLSRSFAFSFSLSASLSLSISFALSLSLRLSLSFSLLLCLSPSA